MYPRSFHREGDLVILEYDPAELAEFHKLGEQDGNVGFYLETVNSRTLQKVFKCYGTYENPSKGLHTMTFTHLEAFDGKLPVTDKEWTEYCKPPPVPEWMKTMKLVFLNTGEEEINDPDLRFVDRNSK